ncbi:APC family permease [Nocardia sp. NPDC058176]|uniref:APC family permease n=1 Tax=Nocardia sp. NPDC058176 TaxID=3346368 RepID=UPI0036DAC897
MATGQAKAEPTRVGPRAVLGVPHLVFFVIATAAPVGFVVSATPLAIGRGGVGTVSAFVVTALVLALFAVGYVAMANRVRGAGGLSEFVTEGLGRIPGVGAAYVAVATYACAATGAIGVFAVFADIASADVLGVRVHWALWAVAATVLMAVCGVLQVEANARLLGVVICVEVAMLVVVVCAVLFRGGAEGLSAEPWQPGHVFNGHAGAMFAVAFSAFAGFEATVIYAREVRDRRTIARATFLVILLLAALYSLVTWALITAYGNSGAVAAASADPTAFFFTVTRTYVGTWAVHVFEVLVLASWLASIIAFHNATARYLATMGANAIAPAWLTALHRRSGAPWKAGLAHTTATLIVIAGFWLADADPYLDLYVMTSVPAVIGVPLLELLASVAIFVYFLRRAPSRRRTVLLTTSALAAICLATIIGLIVANIDLFTARSGAVNVVLPLIVFAVFAAGMGWAGLHRVRSALPRP